MSKSSSVNQRIFQIGCISFNFNGNAVIVINKMIS